MKSKAKSSPFLDAIDRIWLLANMYNVQPTPESFWNLCDGKTLVVVSKGKGMPIRTWYAPRESTQWFFDSYGD